MKPTKEKNKYTVSKAILDAVQGGYEWNRNKTSTETLADPQFWLFLGIGLGWQERMACPVHGEVRKSIGKFFCSGADYRCIMIKFMDYWKFQQHQYVSWLQMGGKTEDFFAELK